MRKVTNKKILRGRVMASVMASAWRPCPPPLDISAQELADITSALLETGGGALGWWRVRHSQLRSSPAAQRLKQAYWLHSLQAALHEKQVAQAVSLLRSAGVEPLLAKGRAVARAYPELGLRPYGDIDLFVPPSQYVDAQAALSAPGVRAVPVDLHCGFADLFDLDDRTIDELYRRAEGITVGDVQVRILGAEDHLRFLCLHLLRHGLWRAIWLCDIGAILESQPADFDWGYFVSGDQRRSDWVLCVLNLAHQVVAQIPHLTWLGAAWCAFRGCPDVDQG